MRLREGGSGIQWALDAFPTIQAGTYWQAVDNFLHVGRWESDISEGHYIFIGRFSDSVDEVKVSSIADIMYLPIWGLKNLLSVENQLYFAFFF